MVIDLGDFPLRVGNVIEDGLPWGYGPRPPTLDQILIDAAIESGAEFRPGWALVGDAGLHKDPFIALGVCDAFRDAGLLADAIGDGLSSRPMQEALAEFEAKRNAASASDFDQNIAEARFAPVPARLSASVALVTGSSAQSLWVSRRTLTRLNIRPATLQ